MKFLLDVNILVAWGWADHIEHRRVALWLATMKKDPTNQLLTSAIPQLGFVRISVQRLGGKLSVAEASSVLSGMLRSLGKSHGFLPDDQSSAAGFPDWCAGASRSTDAHLKLLADRHSARLATLDRGIPGAYLVPIASPS